jgi:hypothetical protein
MMMDLNSSGLNPWKTYKTGLSLISQGIEDQTRLSLISQGIEDLYDMIKSNQ